MIKTRRPSQIMSNNIIDTGDLEFVVTTGVPIVPLPRQSSDEDRVPPMAVQAPPSIMSQQSQLGDEKPTEAVLVEEASDTATPYTGERSKAEKKLVRKLDCLIPLMLGISYFFAYLDRGAIGNARIMGLQKDLHLTNDQYFNCLLIFFIGYAVWEGPAFYLIRRFHAPTVYAGSTIVFGLGALLTAYATTYAHLLVARLFIGLAEATIQTGFVYMSLWYRREEMSVRTGYIFAFTPFAGAVSGLISYGIQRGLDDAGGRPAWEWLFIIEGAATLIWAVVLFFIFPEMPDKELATKRSRWYRASWFNDPEERRLIVLRSQAAHQVMDSKVQLWQMKVAFMDPKVWILAIVTATHAASLTGFSVFLPTFINAFGFSRLVTQLYTIIPYAVALISLLAVSRLADHFVMRSVPLLIVTGVAIAGFTVLIANTNPAVGVFASSLVTAGVYPGVVIVSGWIPSSNAGYTKRATAMWTTQIFCQAFSIMVSKIYDKPPRFFKGHGVMLGLMVVTFGGIIVLTYLMRRHNQMKDAVAADWEARGETNPDEMKSLEEMLDAHPKYRYLY